jgi:hypothetical protein
VVLGLVSCSIQKQKKKEKRKRKGIITFIHEMEHVTCMSNLLYFPTSILCCCFRIERIDKCFSHDTVEEIVDALVKLHFLCNALCAAVMCLTFEPLFSQENEAANSYNEWCKNAIGKIKEASPLSLKVTLHSVG